MSWKVGVGHLPGGEAGEAESHACAPCLICCHVLAPWAAAVMVRGCPNVGGEKQSRELCVCPVFPATPKLLGIHSMWGV